MFGPYLRNHTIVPPRPPTRIPAPVRRTARVSALIKQRKGRVRDLVLSRVSHHFLPHFLPSSLPRTTQRNMNHNTSARHCPRIPPTTPRGTPAAAGPSTSAGGFSFLPCLVRVVPCLFFRIILLKFLNYPTFLALTLVFSLSLWLYLTVRLPVLRTDVRADPFAPINWCDLRILPSISPCQGGLPSLFTVGFWVFSQYVKPVLTFQRIGSLF